MSDARATLTGSGNFFEDFRVGERFRHHRGKTITDFETQTLALLVMNTSQGHFNADFMRSFEFGPDPLTFGGIVASVVLGLASQDTAEHAARELGIDYIRLLAPTVTGDTLYAATEVLATGDGETPGDGLVRFRHLGFNQHGRVVCEISRRVLLQRRPEAGR